MIERAYPKEQEPGAIVTYSGRVIRPLEPEGADFCIEDIAHSLANSCRFTGHVHSFYSVAQHSVLVSEIVPVSERFAGLMHDASEAYLSDISRPVKRQRAFGSFYKEAEERLMYALAEHFGFLWPASATVHWADDVLLRSEQRDLMPNLLRVPGDDYLDFTIVPMLPEQAETYFLHRYHELTGEGQ